MRSQDSGCVYEYHGGIHRFTVVKATSPAVDEFLFHLQRILAETPASEPVRILMDLRPEGLPPIGQMLIQLRTFFRQQSRPAPLNQPTCIDAAPLIHLLPTLLNMIRQRATRRFFMEHEEAEAIAWLMEDESKTRG